LLGERLFWLNAATWSFAKQCVDCEARDSASGASELVGFAMTRTWWPLDDKQEQIWSRTWPVCGAREISVLHSITVTKCWTTWTWGNYVPDDFVVSTSSFSGAKQFPRQIRQLGGRPQHGPPNGSLPDVHSSDFYHACRHGINDWYLQVIEVDVRSTDASKWTVKEIWSIDWSEDHPPEVSFQSS
jgi:hypothetical protein